MTNDRQTGRRGALRILLSAYACEPNRGSEPGIGWNWASELDRQGHHVVVLTRTNNREAIEAALAKTPTMASLTFAYYDLPVAFLFLKRLGLLPMQIYYLLWQVFCVRTARRAVLDHDVDVVWHLTFGAVRLPSLLWRLGKPFVFGPGGGGEYAPFAMRRDYPLGGQLRDLARDALNWLSKFDPLLRTTFAKAALIFVKTPESARLVPRGWRDKTKVYLENGVAQVASVREATPPAGRILYAGSFVYLKGIPIAIRAFAAFVRLGGVGRFTLVGRGSEKVRCQRLARELGVDHLLDWISWVDQRELDRIYAAHDLFLFPSLHDSSGNVVAEAMSHGLPVIGFDLGGPAQIITKDSGVIVATARLDSRTAAQALGLALKNLFDDPVEFRRLSLGALQRAKDFTWSARISGAVQELRTSLSLTGDACAKTIVEPARTHVS